MSLIFYNPFKSQNNLSSPSEKSSEMKTPSRPTSSIIWKVGARRITKMTPGQRMALAMSSDDEDMPFTREAGSASSARRQKASEEKQVSSPEPHGMKRRSMGLHFQRRVRFCSDGERASPDLTAEFHATSSADKHRRFKTIKKKSDVQSQDMNGAMGLKFQRRVHFCSNGERASPDLTAEFLAASHADKHRRFKTLKKKSNLQSQYMNDAIDPALTFRPKPRKFSGLPRPKSAIKPSPRKPMKKKATKTTTNEMVENLEEEFSGLLRALTPTAVQSDHADGEYDDDGLGVTFTPPPVLSRRNSTTDLGSFKEQLSHDHGYRGALLEQQAYLRRIEDANHAQEQLFTCMHNVVRAVEIDRMEQLELTQQLNDITVSQCNTQEMSTPQTEDEDVLNDLFPRLNTSDTTTGITSVVSASTTSTVSGPSAPRLSPVLHDGNIDVPELILPVSSPDERILESDGDASDAALEGRLLDMVQAWDDASGRANILGVQSVLGHHMF